ncbi:MAG TPA: hypothetical protein VKG01_01495 [Thermoanaerobaculia bacterium]|nr:hypothetical protein [Thermoanaerobaculia bacterium]
MRRRISGLIAAIAILAVAGAAQAQNADPNTGGPTKNTLRLKLVEPVEGASIAGTSVRVAVDYNHNVFGTGSGTKFGESNFPQPRFDIFLDNTRVATLKGTESNTTVLENVPMGTHKIAIVALNVSGEVIDRKEVNVTTTATTTIAEKTTTTSTMATAPAPAAPAPEPPPAPAPAYVPPPAPAPAAPVESALPHTASSSPRLALFGLALVAAGLFVGRKTR